MKRKRIVAHLIKVERKKYVQIKKNKSLNLNSYASKIKNLRKRKIKTKKLKHQQNTHTNLYQAKKKNITLKK